MVVYENHTTMEKIDGTQNHHRISLIAALGQNRELGKGNQLLWRIAEDLKRFKTLTTGHPVIMGRKTFESIMGSLGKPLPERTNIIVTHDPEYKAPEGVIVTNTFPEALSYAKDSEGSEEIFVIGGGQIYEAALPFANRLYLTLIEDSADADTFYPAYEEQFHTKVSEEHHESNGLPYSWVTLER